MNIKMKIVNFILSYVETILKIYKVLTESGILKEEKVAPLTMHLCVKAFDCIERMEYNIYGCLERAAKELGESA